MQSIHVSNIFAMEHYDLFSRWYSKSNYLAFLSVNNEYELMMLVSKANSMGIKYSLFREPDIGDQITTIALEPCDSVKKLCGNLPLALK